MVKVLNVSILRNKLQDGSMEEKIRYPIIKR